jgi:3-oxoacyl-[acyl-carrier-protein] synthase-3
VVHRNAPLTETGRLRLPADLCQRPGHRVNSILWPNPAFDNNITVAGPLVKEMAGRCLARMLAELAALPNPSGRAGSVLESVDLVVPHQANKTMVGSPRQAMPVR